MAKSYSQITPKTPDLSVIEADWDTSVVSNINNQMIPPMCNVYRTTDLSANNATWTQVTCDAERFDTDTLHSTSTNTQRITIGTTGFYFVLAWGCFTNNGTGARYLRITKNGTTPIAYDNQEYSDAGNWTFLMAHRVALLAAGDYIYSEVYQTSGGALTWHGSGTNEATGFAALWTGVQ